MSESGAAPAGQAPRKEDKPRRLNRRQKRFADLYLTGLKGAECLRRMGEGKVPGKEDRTPQQLADRAYNLLKLPQVQTYMAERRKCEEEAYGIRKEAVMRRLYLASSTESSVADFVDKNGRAIPLKDLPPEIASLIVKLEVEEVFEGVGENRKHVGTNYKYWLQDGKGSAEVLARCMGWNKDKLDVSTNAPAPVITIMAYEDADDAERAARAAVSGQPPAA